MGGGSRKPVENWGQGNQFMAVNTGDGGSGLTGAKSNQCTFPCSAISDMQHFRKSWPRNVPNSGNERINRRKFHVILL